MKKRLARELIASSGLRNSIYTKKVSSLLTKLLAHLPNTYSSFGELPSQVSSVAFLIIEVGGRATARGALVRETHLVRGQSLVVEWCGHRRRKRRLKVVVTVLRMLEGRIFRR